MIRDKYGERKNYFSVLYGYFFQLMIYPEQKTAIMAVYEKNLQLHENKIGFLPKDVRIPVFIKIV